MKSFSLFIKKYSLALFALFVVPGVAHALYSRYGFNQVTDYGFILAQSRRLLDGQIPHLDFISIRPVGSAFLHLPEVLIGGDFTFYLSKAVVWFQFGVITYIWTQILDRSFKLFLSDWIKGIIIIVGFAFASHNFLLTPWHTLDGIFLISLGYYLLTIKPKSYLKILAYFLIGFAYICKQNFLPVPILVLIIQKDYRNWKMWLATATPALLYLIILISNGAINSAFVQFTAQSDLSFSAWKIYSFRDNFIYGLIYGTIIIAIISVISRKLNKVIKILATFALLACLYWLMWSLNVDLSNGNAIINGTFLPFGLLLGLMIGQIISEQQWLDLKTVTVIAVISWLSVVSMGYLTPALASGILVTTLSLFMFAVVRKVKFKSVFIVNTSLFIIYAIFVTASFNNTRLNHIYADAPAKSLVSPMGDIFPGARGLRTYQENREVLLELREVIKRYQGKRYAILPDYASYWVKSKDKNPISIDWAIDQELYDFGHQRVYHDLERLTREGGIIILEKFNDSPPYRAILDIVPEKFSIIEETTYFRIYQ